MRVAAILAVLVIVSVATSGQEKIQRPIHIMDDGFAYEVVDFGIGLVRGDFGRNSSALWLKLKITNLSQRQLLQPRHPSMRQAIDDAKNIYSVSQRTIQRVQAPSGRYKPHESSIELLTISTSELIDGITVVKVMLGDSKSLGRSCKFFEIRNPQERMKDFDSKDEDPDPLSLSVEARSAFLPPIPD